MKCGYQLGKKLGMKRKMKVDIRGQMLSFCSVYFVFEYLCTLKQKIAFFNVFIFTCVIAHFVFQVLVGEIGEQVWKIRL